MSSMKMVMTVTPDSNVDRKAMAVVDSEQVGKISFDWNKTLDIVSIEDGGPSQKAAKDLKISLS